MNQEAFADFLLDEGVFKLGDFTLKSGQKSPFFLNFGDLCSGRQLRQLGQFFAQAIADIRPTPTLIFGPAYKGIPLAVATAQCAPDDMGYFSFRKEVKSHGEVSPLLGMAPRPGDRIVLIDDVLTTSQTKLEALEQLSAYAREHSLTLEWSGVLVGVDRQGKNPEGITWAESFTRQTGLPVYSLLRLEDLLLRAEQRGLNVEACRR